MQYGSTMEYFQTHKSLQIVLTKNILIIKGIRPFTLRFLLFLVSKRRIELQLFPTNNSFEYFNELGRLHVFSKMTVLSLLAI